MYEYIFFWLFLIFFLYSLAYHRGGQSYRTRPLARGVDTAGGDFVDVAQQLTLGCAYWRWGGGA